MIISTIVSFINYDVEQRIESPSPRSTVIRIDLPQLGCPYHTTYAGLGLDLNLHISTLTRILQNMNGSGATRQHSTPPPCATPSGFTGCVHATLTISPLLVSGWPFT